jgi:hypothetical protein
VASAAAVADTEAAADSSNNSAHQQQQQQQRVLPDDYYYKALRNAITPSVRAFKAAAFHSAISADQPVSCPVSGVPVTWDNSDVDHAAPHTFLALVQGWLQQQGMSLSDVITPSGDNTTSSAMSCPVQLQSWVEYHEEHAVLRVLSRQAHWQVKSQSSAASGPSSSDRGSSNPDSGSAELCSAELADSSSLKGRSRRRPQRSSDPSTADSSGEGSRNRSDSAGPAELINSSSSSAISASRRRRRPA